jgi:hypothetical protein
VRSKSSFTVVAFISCLTASIIIICCIHHCLQYWAAARLLEKAKWEKQQEKKKGPSNGKRKQPQCMSVVGGSEAASNKKSKKELTAEGDALLDRINGVPGDEIEDSDQIYDSCPEVVKKIKDFLEANNPGVSKASFCQALGGINNNSLGRFLLAKQQDQCANVAYRNTYVFFEKKRILDGQAKSKRRGRREAVWWLQHRTNQWMVPRVTLTDSDIIE